MANLTFIDRLMRPILKIIIKHRWGYTEQEFAKASQLGFFDMLNMEAMRYWVVAEPVCSSHCSGCHNEGRPFFFNPLGMLMRHKCPPGICIHGLSQISPLIYNYYDHMLQGKDPNQMIFDHVACTDAGVEFGGLGDNLFRIRRERMPFLEFVRFMLTMSPYLLLKNKRARGSYRAAKDAPTIGGPVPNEFMQGLTIAPKDLEIFLASPKRNRRLRSIEKFKDYHIVIEVVSSQACIAGHREDDEFHIDMTGRVLQNADSPGICIMALHKIWWRVMLMLERMATGNEDKISFEGKLFDLPMSCYGAGLPLGTCGKIMMKVRVQKMSQRS